MLLIYTGDGKGKTSACVGQAIRAIGQGMRVAFGQFMKKADQAGEQKMLANLLGDNFLACGAGFFREAGYEKHRTKALELLAWATGRVSDGLDMLVLDETLYAMGYRLVLDEEIRALLDICARTECHVVLSGRGVPDWLVEQADIVSHIAEVKHIYASGGKARPGIEY